MPDVFVSYSRVDSDFGRKLHSALEKRGRDVWMDWEDIPLTADWWNEIKEGIEASDNFVLIMSPDAIGSPICQMEIDHAIQYNKRIIPIFYRDPDKDNAFVNAMNRARSDDFVRSMLDGRDVLKMCGDNWQVLGGLNWVFFNEQSDFDEKFKELNEAIDLDLTHVKLHTRYLLRAIEWDDIERNPSFLLTGDEIASAEAWLNSADTDNKSPESTALHRDYIAASRVADESQKRRLRNLRWASAIAGTIGILAILATVVAGVFARNATSTAVTAQAQAEGANQIIGTSTSVIGTQVADVQNAQFSITNANVTLGAISAQVRERENTIRALDIVTLGQDIFRNGNNQPLGLALAYEASLIDASPQVHRILSELAYHPGPRFQLDGHSRPIVDAEFSPDGRYLLSTSGDGLILLWDTNSGEIIDQFEVTVFDQHDAFLIAKFSPDGQSMLIAHCTVMDEPYGNCLQSDLILWDIASHEVIYQFEFEFIVNNAFFSPDGQNIILSICEANDDVFGNWCVQNAIILWSIDNNETVQRFDGHTDMVWSMDVSSDGNYLVSGSCIDEDATECTEGEMFLWEVNTGELVRRFEGHSQWVTSMVFSSDDQSIVSGSRNGEIYLWDTTTGEIIRSYSGRDFGDVNILLSPDDKTIVSATNDNLIVWDVSSGNILYRLGVHVDRVTRLSYNPVEDMIVSGSLDGSLIMWDLNNSHKIQHFHDYAISEFAYSPDRQSVLFGYCIERDEDNLCTRSELSLWNIDTGELIDSFEGHAGNGHAGHISSVAFGTEQDTILSASCGEYDSNRACKSAELYLRDYTTGEILQHFEGHTDYIRRIDVSPDGQTVITQSRDGELIFWDIPSATIIRRFEEIDGFNFWLTSDIAFSPDGQYAVFGSCGDGRDYQNQFSVCFNPYVQDDFFLWEVATGEIIQVFRSNLNETITGFAYSPDGRTIISASCRGINSRNCQAYITEWEVASGKMLQRLSGHSSIVLSIVFSPDGKTAVSSSTNGTTILWDLQDGNMLHRFEIGTRELAFSSNGEAIYAMDDVGTLSILPNLDLVQLQNWVRDYRYLQQLECYQLINYGLPNCFRGTIPAPTYAPTRIPNTHDGFQMTSTALIQQATTVVETQQAATEMATP